MRLLQEDSSPQTLYLSYQFLRFLWFSNGLESTNDDQVIIDVLLDGNLE